ncbi:hypothetical protein [Xanthomonas oryzae]|uniref:hypothetical protein n=1 Tax=Xanthomonas oryzae TaxID=347 RepID=UPI00041D55E4|nr:hypothetical protein [Xanthomonas oryzae]ALS95142.1 hypothetical protein AXO1947_12065 [Xanthomonas oryzae pv. oryzae]AUI90320.1 hypothetical protein BVV16_09260 [Xanthomonas oryzae pv. oryzae]AUI93995.1 hypothetical protein BVV17_09270 [Xanthomonas oryzae pv. oryzae]AUI97664.1 hypothetical protein BVV18_09275 [Xanthomonas oryzae pv. oryzae]AUJ01340.1 hypothetical protein BVV10_09280 [Xanthomonas oryzae pv. oryzae]
MKFKHIVMLTLGAAAVAALPAMAQAAPQQTGQGAAAQKAGDAKVKSEAERKSERRAAAAAQKPKGDVSPREEEEEQTPVR